MESTFHIPHYHQLSYKRTGKKRGGFCRRRRVSRAGKERGEGLDGRWCGREGPALSRYGRADPQSGREAVDKDDQIGEKVTDDFS